MACWCPSPWGAAAWVLGLSPLQATGLPGLSPTLHPHPRLPFQILSRNTTSISFHSQVTRKWGGESRAEPPRRTKKLKSP